MTPRRHRIVVTGSRDWVDPEPIHRKLAWAVAQPIDECRIIICHGAYTGADAIADGWARRHGHEVERFPANWTQLGKAAGPLRNLRMIEAGADLLLAFPFGGRKTSGGTWGCVEIAAVRGVPMVITPMVPQ